MYGYLLILRKTEHGVFKLFRRIQVENFIMSKLQKVFRNRSPPKKKIVVSV